MVIDVSRHEFFMYIWEKLKITQYFNHNNKPLLSIKFMPDAILSFYAFSQ